MQHFDHFDNLCIIFEATGIYSDNLKEFCSKHEIKTYILNLKQSHNFAKSLRVRSKTDKIGAHTIWRYHLKAIINSIANAGDYSRVIAIK